MCSCWSSPSAAPTPSRPALVDARLPRRPDAAGVSTVAADELVLSGPRAVAGTAAGARRQGDLAPRAAVRAMADGRVARHRASPAATTSAAPRRALGATSASTSARRGRRAVTVDGRGVDALAEPARRRRLRQLRHDDPLLAGLLAGRPFLVVLTGDESLVQRPMARVVEPLRAMGAHARRPRRRRPAPPLVVRGGDLAGLRHELAVASAQVKTALCSPASRPTAPPRSSSPRPSRDHTERMLGALGAPVTRLDERTVRVTAGAPAPFELARARRPVVGRVLRRGRHDHARLRARARRRRPEPDPHRVRRRAAADGRRRSRSSPPASGSASRWASCASPARPCTAPRSRATRSRWCIDEIPVLAVAAAFAEGVTEIRDAGRAAGEGERPDRHRRRRCSRGSASGSSSGADALVVRGGRPRRGELESHGDHRIAMAGGGRRATRSRARPGAAAGARSPASYPEFTDRPRRRSREARLRDQARRRHRRPAGSGKSTVARGRRRRARPADPRHRRDVPAVALAALEAGVDLDDADAVAAVARTRRHRARATGHVRLDGRDVSDRDPRARGHRRRSRGVGASRGARGARRPPAGVGRRSTAGAWSRAATSAPSCSPTRRSRCSSPRATRCAPPAASATRRGGARRSRSTRCATRSTGRDRADGTARPCHRGPRTPPPTRWSIDTSDATADEVDRRRSWRGYGATGRRSGRA